MNELNKVVSGTFQKKLDVDISRYDQSFVAQIIKNRQQELHLKEYYNYLDYLIENEKEREIFENMLKISYSIFFRNMLTFNTLEQIIIPKLLLKRNQNGVSNLRVWSAACASGQEPYSLAMVLERCISKNLNNNKYQIFATDIDPTQIENAKTGVYTAESMNNITLFQLQNWFIISNSTYLIKDELKQNITFSVFDLLNEKRSSPPESIFGDFDIIMCANILFYFNENSRKTIFNKLIASALPNTIFITGEVERAYFISKQFIELYPHSAIFQLPYNYQL